tara:strand:- start:2574 stop:3104 length:531 start_codon:yes stop_codon:yes gene_type:complete
MAVQLINIGSIANDGTGDDLREAFRKTNENFDELDLRQPEFTTASNIGTLGVGVFAQKSVYDLQFKNVVGGNGISVAAVAGNNVQISTNLQGFLVISDSGSRNVDDNTTLNIYGGNGIQTTLVGNVLTINADDSVSTTDLDFGTIRNYIISNSVYSKYDIDIDYNKNDFISDFGDI